MERLVELSHKKIMPDISSSCGTRLQFSVTTGPFHLQVTSLVAEFIDTKLGKQVSLQTL